jgi:hypothetical protein
MLTDWNYFLFPKSYLIAPIDLNLYLELTTEPLYQCDFERRRAARLETESVGLFV